MVRWTKTLERALNLIQYVVRPGWRIVARDVVANLLEVAGRVIGEQNPKGHQRSRSRSTTSAAGCT